MIGTSLAMEHKLPDMLPLPILANPLRLNLHFLEVMMQVHFRAQGCCVVLERDTDEALGC